MESSSSLGLVLGPGFVQGRESRARAILLQRLLGTRLRACNRRPLAHLRGSPPRTLKRQWKPRVPQECPILAPPHPQALANPPNNTGSCPPPFLPKPLGSRFKAWTAFSNFGERVQLLARSPSPLRCHFFFPTAVANYPRRDLEASAPGCWRQSLGAWELERERGSSMASSMQNPTVWFRPGRSPVAGSLHARAQTQKHTYSRFHSSSHPHFPAPRTPPSLGWGLGGRVTSGLQSRGERVRAAGEDWLRAPRPGSWRRTRAAAARALLPRLCTRCHAARPRGALRTSR